MENHSLFSHRQPQITWLYSIIRIADTQQFLECRDRVTVGDSPKSSRSIDVLNQHGSTTASAGLGFTPQAPSRP